MLSITELIILGPMPEDHALLSNDLYGLIEERQMDKGKLWHVLGNFWPSHLLPPYTIPVGWIWTW